MSEFDNSLRDEVKSRASLVDEISRVVRLKRAGREYSGCCPFHQEKTPSFTVNEEKGFYHCFGCGAHGDVIGFVVEYHSMEFKTALDYLAAQCGLQPMPDGITLPKRKPIKRIDDGRAEADRLRKIEWARKYWKKAIKGEGTLVEPYLASRGIHLPPPVSIRFSGSIRHQESADYWPCMISAVQQPNGYVTGVHRTFLARDGSGKAPVISQKKMMGVCYGGTVRLAKAGRTLGITEGIETGFAVMQSIPGFPVWAALTLDNMAFVTVPEGTEEVVLLADSDTKDMEMGRDRMDRAAKRIAAQGKKVRIAWPPDGQDFNDVLETSALNGGENG
ncbi:MAG: CHC2 zinc finger domain-containing protein [Sneathiella sp.]